MCVHVYIRYIRIGVYYLYLIIHHEAAFHHPSNFFFLIYIYICCSPHPPHMYSFVATHTYLPGETVSKGAIFLGGSNGYGISLLPLSKMDSRSPVFTFAEGTGVCVLS